MKNQLTIVLVLFTLSGMAQKLPDWIINKPSPTNNTYLYVVESATGKNELEARNRAIGEVFRSTAMRIGQPFDSEEINRALQRGTEYYVISSQYNIPINKVCEFTDNKVSPCRVYVLCQVAKAGNIRVEFDDFNACYEGANKVYADEALYADGFTISRNGEKLSDREIRTLFANSQSYNLYDSGMRTEKEKYSTVFYISGGVAAFTGACMQVAWIGASSTKSMMEKYEGNEFLEDEYNKYKEEYEKNKKTAETGLLVLGGGAALIAVGVIVENVIHASGKAKIRKAVNLYNNGKMYSQSNVEMEYGLAGSSVYLTFKF